MFFALLCGVLASFFALGSCSDDNEGSANQYAPVYINGRDALNKSINQKRLSVEQICKGDSIGLTYNQGSVFFCEIVPTEPAFLPIDTINMRISLLNENIADLNDPYGNPFFEEQYHWYIQKIITWTDYDDKGMLITGWGLGDTIAYIPTAQRMAAVDTLNILFKDKEANWDKICKIYTDAFIFIPCTGEEYKELEAAGLN